MKAAIPIVALIGTAAIGALSFAAVDAREIGRSDPRKAARFRPPLFNFSETYTDGSVLGVAVGSTRAEAIGAAERVGLTVQPSGWGDNRAGGATLYERSELLATMLRQPHLDFFDPKGPKGGMTMWFRGGRVVAIGIYYVNFEAI
jgi:hypothetical protein